MNLRNDIIMRNVIHGNDTKKSIKQKGIGASLVRFFGGKNLNEPPSRLAGPFITAGSNQQGRAARWSSRGL